MVRKFFATLAAAGLLAGCQPPLEIPERSFQASRGGAIAVISIAESIARPFDPGSTVDRTRSVGTERLTFDDVKFDRETGEPVEIQVLREREMVRDATNAATSYIVTPLGARNFAVAGVATTMQRPARAYEAGGPLGDLTLPEFYDADPETGEFPPIRLGRYDIVILDVDRNTISYRIED